MIDPPSGWKYGFPLPLPPQVKDTIPWLLDHGYPQEEVDLCGSHFYCRYWEHEMEEEDLPAYYFDNYGPGIYEGN